MKRIPRLCVLILFGAILVGTADAQSASTAWRTVINRCALTQEITRPIYFGSSNTLGPGSVWQKGSDGSVVNMFAPADPFPKADMSQFVTNNKIEQCSGDSSTAWDLNLGLPFTTSTASLSLDLAATLRQAHSVTVSIDGFAIDNLRFTNWLSAILNLGPENRFFQTVILGDYLISANAVRIEGMKVVFGYNTPISAKASAKLKNKRFSTGSNGVTLGVDVTSDRTITVTTAQPDVYILAEIRRLKPDATARAQITNLRRNPNTVPAFGLPNFRLGMVVHLPDATKFDLNAAMAKAATNSKKGPS